MQVIRYRVNPKFLDVTIVILDPSNLRCNHFHSFFLAGIELKRCEMSSSIIRSYTPRNADREAVIFPLQLTTSRIGNFTRLIHIHSRFMSV